MAAGDSRLEEVAGTISAAGTATTTRCRASSGRAGRALFSKEIVISGFQGLLLADVSIVRKCLYDAAVSDAALARATVVQRRSLPPTD